MTHLRNAGAAGGSFCLCCASSMSRRAFLCTSAAGAIAASTAVGAVPTPARAQQSAVGRPILIHLSTKDVIHSFGLYEMRVKQDAIPGMDIPVWFVPTVTTDEMRQRLGKADFDYEITCSQLCGLGHFRMRGYVIVQTAADFQKWMADQVKDLKTGN